MKSNEERVMSIMNKAKIYKRKRGEIISTVTLGVCMAVAVIAGLNISQFKKTNSPSEFAYDNMLSGETLIESKEGELVAFASKEELISKLEENAKKYEDNRKYLRYDVMADGVAVAESAVEMNSAAKSVPTESAQDNSNDYSKTNVQTQGVDESDIIKTDGKRIFYMSSERRNVKVFEDTDNKIKLVKTIELAKNDEDYIYGDSMFLDDKYLVVIGTGSKRMYDGKEPNEESKLKESNVARKITYIPYRTRSYTEVCIYDVNNFDLIRRIETEGNLVSSRKIGDSLYLVTNKYINYYSFYRDDVMPLYKDTAVGEDYKEVSIESIRGFKDFDKEDNCNYMIITALNVGDKNSKVNIDTYLGAGSEIYCSTNSLFVTKPNYKYSYRYPILIDTVAEVNSVATEEDDEVRTSTSIHKFAIQDGKATYIATGKVNGTLLNQFSMDEYKGNFRITTTDEKGNNLYVLDSNLKQIGSIENLANGERIYSTRFMGDKAYVVTYKTVDPLFVIDLVNPSKPTVLGELKIPGYSSYLHPLGNHYLLGFGEDSVEKSYIDWEGKQQVVAYATGLKMAIFDVADYSNPKELYSVKIGGRGSSSELLYNHKALLLDEAKKIFAFPVNVNKEAGFYEDGTPRYGDLEFSGALVYNIDVEEGFSLKGKISHDEVSRYSNIERIIYIGDKFYTVSNSMIKSTDMNTMKEVNSLKF